MYTISFRVVQLKYRPLLGFKQSVPNLVVVVQTCRLDYYPPCGVGNVRHKFQGCTVDEQDFMGFKQSVPNLVVGVQTFLLYHGTVYEVGNVQYKFQGCAVDVQAVTGF